MDDVGVVVDIENGFFGFKEYICVRAIIFCKGDTAGRNIPVAEVLLESTEWLVLEEWGFSATTLSKGKSTPWETPSSEDGLVASVCPTIGATDDGDMWCVKDSMDGKGGGWIDGGVSGDDCGKVGGMIEGETQVWMSV